MRLLFFGLFLFISACGGRASHFVQEKTNVDAQLTCSHISGEYLANQDRMQDITKEKKVTTSNNVGLLIVSPLFLDFSSIEREEILALKKRNDHLILLAQTKKCPSLEAELATTN